MLGKPDISLLTPTYNDSKYISTAIQSVLTQSYKNWELIIIDGSTDNTPEIVKQFAENDNRIKYFREKRIGQLNALLYGAEFVRGRYVSILHSDDEFLDDGALERNTSALRNNDYDGVFCDLLTIDGNGKIYGRTRTVNMLDSFSPALVFLRGGSNIIPDFFFVSREAFNNVLSNYVIWNMPYWLKFEEKQINALKLKKVEPWYKYRVYAENYIRSEVGKFEATNGCLRTVIEIGKRINLPFLEVQRLLARVLKTRLKPLFQPKPCSPKRLPEMMKHVLNNYYDKIPENTYFNGLAGFYNNFPSSRTIHLHLRDNDEIFLGKDARLFFNLIERKRIPTVYEYVLEEATRGFGMVVVEDKESYRKVKNMMRFLNLLSKVKIR